VVLQLLLAHWLLAEHFWLIPSPTQMPLAISGVVLPPVLHTCGPFMGQQD
jgi:hypothetical protein